MNEEAKKLWKTPQGESVLSKWMKGEALSPQDQEHLQRLKQADPPNMQQPKIDK